MRNWHEILQVGESVIQIKGWAILLLIVFVFGIASRG